MSGASYSHLVWGRGQAETTMQRNLSPLLRQASEASAADPQQQQHGAAPPTPVPPNTPLVPPSHSLDPPSSPLGSVNQPPSNVAPGPAFPPAVKIALLLRILAGAFGVQAQERVRDQLSSSFLLSLVQPPNLARSITLSPAGHSWEVVQQQPPALSGHKRLCDEESNSEEAVADSSSTAQPNKTSRKAGKKSAADSPGAAAASSSSLSAASAAASSSAAPETKPMLKPKKGPHAPGSPEQERAVQDLISCMPATVAGPVNADAATGQMEPCSREQMEAKCEEAKRKESAPANIRFLHRVVVSHTTQLSMFAGPPSGVSPQASQAARIQRGQEMAEVALDKALGATFHDRGAQKIQAVKELKGPAKKCSKQANEVSTFFIVQHWPRFTIVIVAANAFNARALHAQLSILTFETVESGRVVNTYQVAKQIVGKGESVSTYMLFYVNESDRHATITLDRALGQCHSHRNHEDHPECMRVAGYLAVDETWDADGKGGFVLRPRSLLAYHVAAMRATTKITPQEAKAPKEAVAACRQAAAAASRQAAEQEVEKANQIVMPTIAAMEAAAAAGSSAEADAATAAAPISSDSNRAIQLCAPAFPFGIQKKQTTKAAAASAPVAAAAASSVDSQAGNTGALTNAPPPRSTSSCSPQSLQISVSDRAPYVDSLFRNSTPHQHAQSDGSPSRNLPTNHSPCTDDSLLLDDMCSCGDCSHCLTAAAASYAVVSPIHFPSGDVASSAELTHADEAAAAASAGVSPSLCPPELLGAAPFGAGAALSPVPPPFSSSFSSFHADFRDFSHLYPGLD